jgi:hypothetical protein
MMVTAALGHKQPLSSLPAHLVQILDRPLYVSTVKRSGSLEFGESTQDHLTPLLSTIDDQFGS